MIISVLKQCFSSQTRSPAQWHTSVGPGVVPPPLGPDVVPPPIGPEIDPPPAGPDIVPPKPGPEVIPPKPPVVPPPGEALPEVREPPAPGENAPIR